MKRTKIITDWDTLPVVISLEQTCAILGICRPTLLGLLRSGKIKSVKTGNKWLIEKQAIRNYLGGETV